MRAILIFSGVITLIAGQPLSEGNEAAIGSNMVLGGALSELVEHDTASQEELGRQRVRISKLSGEREQLQARLRGAEKSETTLKRMLELSDAAEGATRSRCNRRLVELQKSYENKTHSIKKHLHDCASLSARLKQTLVSKENEFQEQHSQAADENQQLKLDMQRQQASQSARLKHLELDMQREKLRATNAENRIIALKKELHQTTQALQLAQSLSHELKSAVTRAEHTQGVLSQQLDAEHKSETGLEKVLADLQTQLADKSTDLSHKENVWSASQKKLRAAFEVEHAVRISKERRLSQFAHELADAFRGLSQTQKERDSAAVADSSCHQEIAQVKGELNLTLASLLASRSNATSTLNELQKTRHELDNTRDELDNTRDGLVIANATVATLRGQMRELAQGRHTAESTITKVKQTSEQELEAAQSKLAIEKQTSDWELEEAQSKLAIEKQTSERELGAAQSKLAAVKQTSERELRAAQSKLAIVKQTSERELGEAQSKLAIAEAELSMDRPKLASTNHGLSVAKHKVEALSKTCDQLKQQMSTLSSDSAKLLSAEHAKMESDLSQLALMRSQLAQTKQELNASLTAAAILNSSRSGFISEQAAMAQKVASALAAEHMQLGAMTLMLRKAHADLMAKDEELGLVRTRFAAANAQVGQLDTMRHKMAAQLRDLQEDGNATVHELFFRLEDSARALAQTQSEWQQKDRELASLRQALQVAATAFASLQGMHEELRGQVGSVSKELQGTRSELDTDAKMLGRVGKALMGATSQEAVELNANRARLDVVIKKLEKTQVREQGALHNVGERRFQVSAGQARPDAQTFDTRRDRNLSRDTGGAEHEQVERQTKELERLHRELAAKIGERGAEHEQVERQTKELERLHRELAAKIGELNVTRGKLFHELREHSLQSAKANERVRFADTAKDQLLNSAQEALHIAVARLNKTRSALQTKEGELEQARVERLSRDWKLTSTEAELHAQAQKLKLAQLALEVDDHAMRDASAERHSMLEELNATRAASAVKDDLLKSAEVALHLALADLNKTRSALQASERARARSGSQRLRASHAATTVRGKSAGAVKAPRLVSDNVQIPLSLSVADSNHVRSSPSAGDFGANRTALRTALADLEMTRLVLGARSTDPNATTVAFRARDELLHDAQEVSHISAQFNKTRLELQVAEQELGRVHMEADTRERELQATQARLLFQNSQLQAAHQALASTDHALSVSMSSQHATFNELNTTAASLKVNGRKLQETEAALHRTLENLKNTRSMLGVQDEELKVARAQRVAEELDLESLKRTLHNKSLELQAAQKALTASAQGHSIRSFGSSKGSNSSSKGNKRSSEGGSKSSSNSSNHAAEFQGTLHHAEAELDQAQLMLRIKLRELATLHADLTARDVKLNATSTELQHAHSKLMMRDAQVAAYEQKLQNLIANQGKQSKDLDARELLVLHSKNEELMAARAALSMTEAKLSHTSVALGLSEHERERLEVLEHNLSTTLEKQGTVLHTVASNFSRVLTEFQALKREEAQLQAQDHSLGKRLGDRVTELNVMHSALKDVSVSLAKSEAKGQQLNRTLATNSILYNKVQMGLAAAEKRTHQLLQELKMLRKRNSQLEATDTNLTSKLSSQGSNLGASLVRDKRLSRDLAARLADLHALQETTATLTRQLNNRSSELLAALAHVHKLRAVNKRLKLTTRKLRIAVATMGKEVVRTRSAATKALAESQQNRSQLDSMRAALTESKQHLTAVEMKDARLRKALHVKERNLKNLRSQLGQAAANTTAVLLENNKLMKELHAEQQELNATRAMLNSAHKLAKDLAQNNLSLGSQVRNQSALGLVTSKRGRSKKLTRLKELKQEVVKIHTLLNHDEQLLRRYRQSQKRLRARLKQMPQQNGTLHVSAEEHDAKHEQELRQLALVRDERKRLMDQNRALLAVVKQLRAKLGQVEGAEMEGQGGAYTP